MEYFLVKCAEHGHSKQLSLNHTAYMVEDILKEQEPKKIMLRHKSIREKYLPVRLPNASPRFVTNSKYRETCRISYHAVHENCQILCDFLERWLWYLRKTLSISGTARTGNYHKVWVRASPCKVSHIKSSDRDTDSDGYPSWTAESLWSVARHSAWREREAILKTRVFLGDTAPLEAQLHSQKLSRNPR